MPGTNRKRSRISPRPGSLDCAMSVRGVGLPGANTFRLIGLGLLGCALSIQVAYGQQRRGPTQYQPANPTMSPYVGLLQGNTGAIPNYFSLVRPRLEQRAFNQQLQSTSRLQPIDIQQSTSSSATPSTRFQTGKNAGFGRYLHYYPEISPAARRLPSGR